MYAYSYMYVCDIHVFVLASPRKPTPTLVISNPRTSSQKQLSSQVPPYRYFRSHHLHLSAASGLATEETGADANLTKSAGFFLGWT